jgi:hypothetical protein
MVVTEFVSAVPINPARDIEASASWDNDGNGLTFFEVPS